MGDEIFVIVLIILAFINWRIYHKMFKVTYFGARAILRELAGCFIAAVVEAAIVMAIANNFFGTNFMMGS